jgi:hypothetical protein
MVIRRLRSGVQDDAVRGGLPLGSGTVGTEERARPGPVGYRHPPADGGGGGPEQAAWSVRQGSDA